MKVIDIHLVDRTLYIDSDGASLDLGDGPHLRYACVQDAVARAMAIIARHLNVRGSKEIVSAFLAERISIQIHGNDRERRVAALHLHLSHGFPDNFERLLSRAALPGKSPYETVRFGDLRAKIDAVVRLLEGWQEVLRGDKEEHSRWVRKQKRVFFDLGWGRQGSFSPLRVGVTGVTGAGKSSFVNALIGRELLPTADSIATAVVTEISLARDDEPEELRVTWLPSREITERIAALKGQKWKLLSKEDEQRRYRELKNLQRARDESARARKQVPISEVERFVRVDATDGVSDGVERVELRIHHPLLAAVTLVDTPGLRDPDPLRKTIALNEVATTDAWVYLVPAPQKPNISVEEDWSLLRREAHNDAGAMILTQLDVNLVTPNETFEQRKTFYRQQGWKGAIEAVALGGRLALQKSPDEAADRLYAFSSFIPRRWPSDNAKVHLISSHLNAVFQRSLSDDSMATLLSDYAADAGGLVACLDLIAVTVAEHGLAKRASRAVETLIEEVESVLVRVRELRDETVRAISTCHSIETLKGEIDRLTTLQREATDQLAAVEAELEKAVPQLRERISSLSQEIDREAATLAGLPFPISEHGDVALDRSLPLWGALNRSVRDDGPLLWGEVSFDVFGAFDTPLSACGTNLLDQFANEANAVFGTLGVSSTLLESSRLMEGFSLHGGDETDELRKTIDDRLAFFELKSTILKRMEHSVIQRAIEVQGRMKRRVAVLMEKQLQIGLDLAKEHRDGLHERAAKLQGILEQQRAHEAALRRQTAPEHVRGYEARLKELEALIARMEEFRARLVREHAQ